MAKRKKRAADRSPRIKVGPYCFSIRWWDGHDQAVSEAYGACMKGEHLFFFQEKGDAADLLEVFIHEINHSSCYIHGIEDGSKEEAFVRQTAMGLATVLVDNPGLENVFSHLTRAARLGKGANLKALLSRHL